MLRAAAGLVLDVEVLQLGLLLGHIRQLGAVAIPVIVPADRSRIWRFFWTSHLYLKSGRTATLELGGVERVENAQMHVMSEKMMDRILAACERIVFFSVYLFFSLDR